MPTRTSLKDFMELSLEERQSHLDMTEPCDEFGCSHSDYRAVLAWYLNTTCDRMGRKTGICCHKCNNRLCGNPKHLYWGTQKENVADRQECHPDLGKKIRNSILVNNPNHFKEAGRKGRSGWKEESPPNKLEQIFIDSRVDSIYLSSIDLTKYGWKQKVADLWGVSHTQVKRFFDTYWKGPAPYQRK